MGAIRADEWGVRRELGGGRVEQVAWDELQEVAIATTGDGPRAEDVLFVLSVRDGAGCVVPQAAREIAALLERLQQLPVFNNEAVIRAKGCAEDARFLCRRRGVAGGGR